MSATLTPAESFAPGEYLRDELEERGWSEAEFAQILGRPVQAISEIMNGRKEITAETAVMIGEALGTSAEVWLNLQVAYRLHLVRSATPPVAAVKRRARMRSLVPVAELRKRGWLPDTDDLDDLEAAVCDLLGIATTEETPQLVAAARRSGANGPFSAQQVAWLARVRNLAVDRAVATFDVAALTALADGLVGRLRDPHDLSQVAGWLAGCGVILVVELPLRASKIDGAVLAQSDGTPVIALSTRGDRFDGFVFTLLHEIAHIILGHVAVGDIRLDEDLRGDRGVSAIEVAANATAGAWVFPNGLSGAPAAPSTADILALARAYGVHPSLVIGRLQWEGTMDWARFRGSVPKVRPFVNLG